MNNSTRPSFIQQIISDPLTPNRMWFNDNRPRAHRLFEDRILRRDADRNITWIQADIPGFEFFEDDELMLHAAYDLLLESPEVDIDRLFEYRSQLEAAREVVQ